MLSLDSAFSYARHISPHGSLQTVPTGGQISSELGWQSVRRCLWKFLVTNFLLLPNLATGAGVSLTLAGSQHEHL